MSNRIPFIALGRHDLGIQPKLEQVLMDKYLFHIANTGNDQRQLIQDFPAGKFIIPIWGWTSRPMDVYYRYDYHDEDTFKHGNVYYYNCGILTTDWETTYDFLGDEFGSHGKIQPMELRPYNYGQAVGRMDMVRLCMPGLKTVATHPRRSVYDGRKDAEHEDGRIMLPKVMADVYAIHHSYLSQFNREDLPEGAELWAYITDTDDLEKLSLAEIRAIGPKIREHGCTCLLLNDKSRLPNIGHISPTGPELTEVAEVLFEGLAGE